MRTGKRQFFSGAGKRIMKERERREIGSFFPGKKSMRERGQETQIL